jgi:hypothetical protein
MKRLRVVTPFLHKQRELGVALPALSTLIEVIPSSGRNQPGAYPLILISDQLVT